MLHEEQELIRTNFKQLVHETDLGLLLPQLLLRNVLTNSTSNYKLHDKWSTRRLYLDLQTWPDPNTFHLLLDSLRASGQDHLVRILHTSPSSPPRHAVPYRMTAVDEYARDLERQLSVPLAINTICETLNIHVVPSIKFHDEINATDDPVYKTRSKHRGIALIINNIKFDQDPERNGAHMDGKNLRELFKQCAIKAIYRENQKTDEIRDEVLKLKRDEELRLYDVAFFVFMSHGKETVYKQSALKGTDGGCVEECWIEAQFNNQNCAALRNKPKIFIFQMCRGDMLDGRTQSDGVPLNFTSPFDTDSSMCDVLIAHSTLPGYRSHRDVVEGSWYINCICKVFMKHAHNQDVEMMLKKVDAKLRKMKSANWTSQTSTFHNVGFKTCYLHPGIYEEDGVKKRFCDE